MRFGEGSEAPLPVAEARNPWSSGPGPRLPRFALFNARSGHVRPHQARGSSTNPTAAAQAGPFGELSRVFPAAVVDVGALGVTLARLGPSRFPGAARLP